MSEREEQNELNSPKEASNDVLQQPDCLLFNQLSDHVTQDHPDRVKPFVSRTDISEPNIVKEDLLHNEDGDRLAQLGPRFHYSEA